jgi:hypothetical protein
MSKQAVPVHLTPPTAGAHMVQFYQDDSYLCRVVAEFISAGIARSEGVVMIARASNSAAICDRLAQWGFPVRALMHSGQLTILDAHTTLASISVDGVPDWEAFRLNVGNVMDRLQQRYQTMCAYGEMVDILWQSGSCDIADRVESFWNELAKSRPFSLLCAYRIDDLDPLLYCGPLQCICGSHSHLLPGQRLPGLEAEVDRVSQELLGPTIAKQVGDFARAHRQKTLMPAAQAKLFYLAEHMPRATDRMLAELRAA